MVNLVFFLRIIKIFDNIFHKDFQWITFYISVFSRNLFVGIFTKPNARQCNYIMRPFVGSIVMQLPDSKRIWGGVGSSEMSRGCIQKDVRPVAGLLSVSNLQIELQANGKQPKTEFH